MAVSLRVSARRLLRWNLKGLAMGGMPRRGLYLAASNDPKKCFACKVGLVMLGRYGRARSMWKAGVLEGAAEMELVDEVQDYGPVLDCPIDECFTKEHLGRMTEHLFEGHLKSVTWIDKWLAGLAGEPNATREEVQALVA